MLWAMTPYSMHSQTGSEYRVKIQAWDFSPGGNFVIEMQKATAECDRTVAVFSPNYFLSEFAEAEWAAAFRLDPTGKNEKLIPVRIEACQPPASQHRPFLSGPLHRVLPRQAHRQSRPVPR